MIKYHFKLYMNKNLYNLKNKIANCVKQAEIENKKTLQILAEKRTQNLAKQSN